MSDQDSLPSVTLPRPVAATVSPQSVTGGQSTLYTVTLSATYATNQTVSMSTDHPEVFSNFPSSLTVLAGQLGTSYTLNTVSPGGTDPVYANITALCNGVSLPCTLTVNP